MSELYGKPNLTLREIEERIEELEDEREEFLEDYVEDMKVEADVEDEDQAGDKAEEAWDDTDEAQELEELYDIQKELDGYVDRDETLIHEDSFRSYAQELADEVVGARDTQWPFNCIDWEAAAEELRGDYSEVEIGGDTYYYRG